MEATRQAGASRRWAARHLLLPFVALVFLVGGGDAAFFRIQPNTRECFILTVKKGDDIIASYDTTPSDTHIDTTLETFFAEGGKPQRMFEKLRQGQGHFRIEAVHLSGEARYQLCFHSKGPSFATLSFHASTSTHQAEQVATEDHTANLKQLVEKIEDRVEEIGYQQEYTATRENVHRQMAEMTNSRVMWWTSFEFVMLLLASGFQTYYLGSLFEVRTIV